MYIRFVATKAQEDSLTGLPGHAACVEAITGILEAKRPAALALTDLDRFGAWNDSAGDEQGDAFIKDWSDGLRAGLDASGAVYRFGGDALMVVWPDTEKEQAFLAIEALREAFAANDRGVTFSAGVAASPEDGEDADTLVRKCSEALYRAKLGGRNKVCLSREEKMVTKTVHYRLGQLEGLTRLAQRESMNEASLLREALDDLLRKYNA